MKTSLLIYTLMGIYFLVGLVLVLGIMFEAKFVYAYDYIMCVPLLILGICFVNASIQTFIRLREK